MQCNVCFYVETEMFHIKGDKPPKKSLNFYNISVNSIQFMVNKSLEDNKY